MKGILLSSALLLTASVQAQVLTGISSKWSDSFGEWTIYTDNQELEGELRLRWLSTDNWTEWEYRLGEETGTIRMKWKDNPNEWEVRGNNEVVTMRTVLNGNFREWRIIGNKNFDWKSRYGNTFDEWAIASSHLGTFNLLTAWEGNPSDWIIEDELDESITLPTKMALVFLSVFFSSPKF
ncbi:MAG: hypothetical protein ACK4TA_05930 [Saprospiraceae bacterium]